MPSQRINNVSRFRLQFFETKESLFFTGSVLVFVATEALAGFGGGGAACF